MPPLPTPNNPPSTSQSLEKWDEDRFHMAAAQPSLLSPSRARRPTLALLREQLELQAPQPAQQTGGRFFLWGFLKYVAAGFGCGLGIAKFMSCAGCCAARAETQWRQRGSCNQHVARGLRSDSRTHTRR
jgi:hypothetical protein